MAILCVSAAPASAATVRSLLRDGIVGTIAPQGWLALILAYSVSIAMWGLLSTVLVRQLAFWIRRSTAIPAVLGIATSVCLYVIAWGVPSGWEWIWAVVLNLWQGAGMVRDAHKKLRVAQLDRVPALASRISADFVSTRGVEDLLRMPSSPFRQKFFGRELLYFHEPGTPPVINPQWSMDAEAEFRRDPKLALVFGGPGQVIFRSALLEQVLLKKSGQIRDWSTLLRAFGECGYRASSK